MQGKETGSQRVMKIEKAIEIFDGMDKTGAEGLAIEYALCALRSAQVRRKELQTVFDAVRDLEQDVLDAFARRSAADRLDARRRRDSAYRDLRARKLFGYYKFYDHALLVGDSGDDVLDMAALALPLP